MVANENLKKLAVWKFASCDGCQLSILDLEDEILLLALKLHIAYFPEATSSYESGPYDLSLVEGSITTEDDALRIQKVRNDSKFLVTIGACATAGGIQALRNFGDVSKFAAMVYAKPEYIKTLADSTAISSHVKVDYELRGCPINKFQLLEVVTSFLHSKRPDIVDESVCMECKRKGTVCVIVTQNKPCLGPVTHGGCDAICPTYNRGCFGCYGPKENPNTEPLAAKIEKSGETRPDFLRLFRNFNAASGAFLEQSKKYEPGKK